MIIAARHPRVPEEELGDERGIESEEDEHGRDQPPALRIEPPGDLRPPVMERGQERLAYERAREALAIDPQNVAAQRLEQRLAEVFAERDRPAEPKPNESSSPELPNPFELRSQQKLSRSIPFRLQLRAFVLSELR